MLFCVRCNRELLKVSIELTGKFTNKLFKCPNCGIKIKEKS